MSVSNSVSNDVIEIMKPSKLIAESCFEQSFNEHLKLHHN